MKEWFEGTVSYEKVDEDGKNKKIKESYLVDALSFTEAEARLIEEITPFINGEFKLKAVKRKDIVELFRDESGESQKWFELEVAFITLDEISGKEKQSKNIMYIQCDGIENVVSEMNKNLKGTMADYLIKSVKETKILDVFEYQEEKQ